MNKKVKRILMIVYILVLVAMFSGATFAYFTMINVSSVSPSVQMQAATTDWLVFNVGEPINIEANDLNFGENMGDLRGTTYGSALLRVNNPEAEIEYNYNIFLEILENDFEYTTSNQMPELLLKVTDPEGIEVTEISGLEYKEVTNGRGEVLSGFDITTANGRFYIAQNYPISATLQNQHIWNVEVVLINLDSNQDANVGKGINAFLQVEQSS